ncbi:hypothetical protein Q0812_04075 [Brevundimonas sp. 2R-24]|uniref:Uncharacterized protein n=1 Tax=Peiella sedimenti TaxID=3061083 RepID=A0ABT8SKU9_9CAUL|nr:hypothetical protein [Caulobacteraceae bacterium XZ-24]
MNIRLAVAALVMGGALIAAGPMSAPAEARVVQTGGSCQSTCEAQYQADLAYCSQVDQQSGMMGRFYGPCSYVALHDYNQCLSQCG